MAKTFPTVEARQELGVTPTRAVRAEFDVSTGEGEVGAAIGQGLLAVGGQILRKKKQQDERRQQIEVKRQKMTDGNSAVLAQGLRDAESLRMAGFKDVNPHDTWEVEALRGAGEVAGQIGELDGSDDFHLNQKARSESYSTVQSSKAFADSTRKLQKNTIAAQETAVLNAFISGDKERIAETTRRYAELGPNMSKSKTTVFNDILGFQAVGGKIRNNNKVKAKKSQAALVPDVVFAEMEAEKELRKRGEGSPELESLTSEDLESIADYTKTIGEQRKSISTNNVEKAKVDAYDKIRDGETNIDAMIDSVNADLTINNEDKAKFAEDIPTYFNKWNSTVAAESSDEDAYDTLTQLSEKVERGAASPAEFEEKYAELKSSLDKDDQRAIRQKDIVATKSMQNRTFSDALFIARPTLVELTASDLDSIKLARQNAEVIKDIPTVNMFNIALKKNQAEQWNMGRFRKELRTQIAQNPEWSQEQIFVAQEILTDQLDLPVGELLKQFDEQNPNSAILKEPPDDDFKDIWPGLDIDQKAKVWELRMRGAPTSVILREFE